MSSHSSNTHTPSSYQSFSRSSSPSPTSTKFSSESLPPIDTDDKTKDRVNFDLSAALFPVVPDPGIPSNVDELDLNTPDRWVKRDSRMVRLTGKHPFNAEARLDTLFAAGFLTPSSLFYVRNHGAVPKIPTFSPSPSSVTENTSIPPPIQLHAHSTWQVRVHGLVEYERSFTVDDLKRLFKVVTLPITLVCAGNRRKEQNVAAKTLGFNWGAAGLSTALFTGVYLADVLKYVHPLHHLLTAHIGNKGNDVAGLGHVIFEGADDDLPNGPYGTSQTLKWAMNKDNGMLLAWKMNGRDLEPDHGFPIRVVIPGQIGGRSVKWLRRIEISAHESQHHLHFRDNKVLPTQVTAQRARDEPKWWYDPKYIIRDLNVNSAIAVPNHNEILPLPSHRTAPEGPYEGEPTYTIRGYAYAGGGKRVNRVEISLDNGESWDLADMIWPEDLYRAVATDEEVYGELDLTDRDTCFCWCFWSCEVSIPKLAASPSIFVRAMDDSLALQPRDMYWNATGMMNNWWFRVVIHHEPESDQGGETLRFEHPTLAGVASGGWMERMKASGEDFLNPRFGRSSVTVPGDSQTKVLEPSPLAPPSVVLTNPNVKRMISIAEYTEHASPSVPPSRRKAMFVVNGEVYDGTAFLDEHPGGADSIWLAAGELDTTEDFIAIHSDDAKRKLVPFHIGTLLTEPDHVDNPEPQEDSGVFLNKRKWKAVTLISVTPVSHDSLTFRFALPSPDVELGLPVGQHVFVRLRRKTATEGSTEGELVQRAYTPVSQQNAKGHIDLLIKLYPPSAKFPLGGKMTMGFHELVLGDSVEVKGPLGSFVWEGRGAMRWKGVPRPGVRRLGLICGGSGITPILQVLRAALHDDGSREVKLWLLDANRTEQDILCREELDEYFIKYGAKNTDSSDDAGAQARFRLHHTLSKPPEHWTFSNGRITDEILKTHLPSPGADALILVCGSEGMVNLTVKPGLQRLGWNTDSSLVVF